MTVLLLALGAGCLAVSAWLARRHLRLRPGLRWVYAGLGLGALAGMAVGLESSLSVARLLAAFILAGMGMVVWGCHLEGRTQSRNRVPLD